MSVVRRPAPDAAAVVMPVPSALSATVARRTPGQAPGEALFGAAALPAPSTLDATVIRRPAGQPTDAVPAPSTVTATVSRLVGGGIEVPGAEALPTPSTLTMSVVRRPAPDAAAVAMPVPSALSATVARRTPGQASGEALFGAAALPESSTLDATVIRRPAGQPAAAVPAPSTVTATVSRHIRVPQPEPVLPPVLLEVFELATDSVQGGAQAAGAIRLDGPAPAGGAVIRLESDNAAARVPLSIRIPEGLESARFEIATAQVAAPVRALISASLAGGVMSRALTVQPPAREVERREVVFEVVAVKLLRVTKISGGGDGNTLPFLVVDVEEQVGGTATCTTPVTVPSGSFTTDVAIHIDADTGGCSVDTNIGASTEAVRISEDGAASAAVAGQNGWSTSTVLILTAANPNTFTATFGGASFLLSVTISVNNPTNTLIRATVNSLSRQ